jgi:membrane-associated phospholipid phosphatase
MAMGALAGVQLVRLGLAEWLGRHRPPDTDWATSATGYSCPSGHTTTAAAVAALLVVVVRRRIASRRLRAAGLAVVIAWAAGVGLTRVYLGVHCPPTSSPDGCSW